jgi:hypothetical protein
VRPPPLRSTLINPDPTPFLLLARPPQLILSPPEREIFMDNLLVRVHWIIEMIVVEGPCAMGL